jgi:hypothetical protein
LIIDSSSISDTHTRAHAHLVRQSRAPVLLARRLAFGRALPRELLLGCATLGGGATTLLLGRATLAHNVGRETAADVDLRGEGMGQAAESREREEASEMFKNQRRGKRRKMQKN